MNIVDLTSARLAGPGDIGQLPAQPSCREPIRLEPLQAQVTLVRPHEVRRQIQESALPVPSLAQ